MNPKHEKIYQEYQDKKIKNQAAQITAIESANKRLRGEYGVMPARMSEELDALKEKCRKQWDYIQELEARNASLAADMHTAEGIAIATEKSLAAAESANAILRANVSVLKESTTLFEKRFLACWDELQEEKKWVAIHHAQMQKMMGMEMDQRKKREASEKAAHVLDEMLKTKTATCDQLCAVIAKMEKELD